MPKAVSVNMELYYDKIQEVTERPEIKAEMIIDKKTGAILKKQELSSWEDIPPSFPLPSGLKYHTETTAGGFPAAHLPAPKDIRKEARRGITEILRIKAKHMLDQNPTIPLPLVEQIFRGVSFPKGVGFRCNEYGCTNPEGIFTVMQFYNHGVLYHNRDPKSITIGLLNVLDKIDNLP